jgi:diguanylate cyclase (GGDEF)-like protein/PAS domain S-box-containing protein
MSSTQANPAGATERAAIDRSIAAAFDAGAVGMVLADLDGRFLRVNDAYCELLGYSGEELTAGMALADVTHPDDVPDLRAVVGTGDDGYRAERRYMRADGDVVWVVASVTVMRDVDGDPIHLLALVQEITEAKRLQADLARLAMQDPLTGLANRTLLDERLRAALARAGRNGSLTGVLFLDLDGFKAINDLHGHSVGDEVLKAVAGHVRRVLRPADVVARLGGDEFVAVCEELTGIEEAHTIASRVEVAVAGPIETRVGALRIDASVGLALAEGSTGGGADDLIRRADEAMYRAKQAGSHHA